MAAVSQGAGEGPNRTKSARPAGVMAKICLAVKNLTTTVLIGFLLIRDEIFLSRSLDPAGMNTMTIARFNHPPPPSSSSRILREEG